MRHLWMCFAVALTTATYGQTLRVDEIDEFEGSEKKITKYYTVGREGSNFVGAGLGRIDDLVFLDIWTSDDLGCGGALGNYIILLYSDGTSKKLEKDENKVQCDDRASSLYIVNDVKLKDVVKIRVRQSEHFNDYVIEGEYTLEDLYNAVQ